jgi:transcriptional regulator with XRE-family HTH domain
MELRVRVGLNIQELRRERGLSQEALAHAAEINRGYFGKLENAKYAASVDMLERIARALDVDPADLLKPR